jgi:peptide/nickel transport system substrate-binding protein
MTDGRGRSRLSPTDVAAVLALAVSTAFGMSCQRSGRSAASPAEITLRIGVAQLSATSSIAGLSQLNQILTVESLARTGDDGRMEPVLAESWTLSGDGRLLTVKLRPGVTFTDGTAFDANLAVKILPDAVRATLGPVSEDIEGIDRSGPETFQIRFRGSSMFHLEALEATIAKPGSTAGIGTGPFATAPNSATEWRGNAAYYLGRPTIDRISVSNYPSVRAAWAEALRGNLDMLYEVSPDALDSLERSKTISTFAYTRHYQHVLVLNSRTPALSAREIRRALDAAVDRTAIVREALRGHGVASSGPVWPKYWALPRAVQPTTFDPARADTLVRQVARQKPGRIRFTCLVPSIDELERVALEVKRQLARVGIEMTVEGVSQDELFQRGGKGVYEAIMIDLVSGPTLVRPYAVWRSGMPLNWGKFGNPTVDAALERVRGAGTEAQYRQAVSDVQQAFLDDPPAIFLAWSVRARAVSTRFIVPPVGSGRDILGTLRLLRPATTELRASRN